MRKLKKILTILFAVIFTVVSNGTYMYFKFIVGSSEAQAVEKTAYVSPSPAVTPAASAANDNLKTDSFGILSFEYPKNWEKRSGNSNVYYYAAKNTFLMLGQNETSQSLDDKYFESILEGFKKQQDNFLEISRERSQNKNGVKYYIVKYNQTIQKENYLCSLVILKVDSVLYLIGFTQPLSNSNNYMEDFSDIIDSLTIKGSR